jgi:hypothetical protein
LGEPLKRSVGWLPVCESLIMSNAGVHNSNVIDLVSHNPQTDIVSLGMIEERDWDGSEQRILELEAKIQNYFSFIVDGQLRRLYPDYVDKPVEMRLFCSNLPDSSAEAFLNQVREKLSEFKIGFVVSLLK